MLRWTLATALAVGALLAVVRSAGADELVYKVGVASRRFVPAGLYDWRAAATHALVTQIWYPAGPSARDRPQRIGPTFGPAFFMAGSAAADAAIADHPATFPLILMSHGTGGSAQVLAWLATALAAHGYMVAAVNHPGNNALEAYTTQGFALWWERARDLSAVLDAVIADREFGPHIDPDRVGAAGHSLGGYTVIELAGGIGSYAQLQASCKAAPDDVSCAPPPEYADLRAKAEALARADAGFAAALAGGASSYRDPRVRAIFAMAPALGPAFAPQSLSAVTTPAAIVVGDADKIAPADRNARFLAANIPQTELTILPGGVGHYAFIDACTAIGRFLASTICTDGQGVDRVAVHGVAAELAIRFFGAHL
jgi:predicted dienelactone hydrolase